MDVSPHRVRLADPAIGGPIPGIERHSAETYLSTRFSSMKLSWP